MARGLVFALCAGLSSAATEFTYSQTQQSATYSIYAASYAFDASEPTPNVAMPSRGAAWLSARLTGSGAGIGDVVVTNRGDAHAAELRKFKVFAGTSAGDTSSTDAHQCGDAAGVLANGVADGMFTVSCGGVTGKDWITIIQLEADGRFLSLANVDVFESATPPAAPGSYVNPQRLCPFTA